MITLLVRLVYLVIFVGGVIGLPSYIVFKFVTPKLKSDVAKVLVAVMLLIILAVVMFMILSSIGANIVLYEQSTGICFGMSCRF